MWIYGASGHGKVILDCLLKSGAKINGFIDDNPKIENFCNFPVIRYDNIDIENDIVILGVGDNYIRSRLARKCNYRYGKVIHPSASVSELCSIGDGGVVFHQSVIQPGCSIGEHCIVNTRASIDHDCIIGSFVHVAPGATVCGSVNIGSNTWVGAGAVIIQEVSVGKNAIIGMGSVVITDVPDNAVVVGNPARIIRYQNEEFVGETNPNVYIIGAGGFGREVEGWICQSNSFLKKYKLKGYIDDSLDALSGYPSQYKIVGSIDNFKFQSGDLALLGLADPKLKESITERLKGKVKFLSFISESSIIGTEITISEGSIIAPNVVITTNIKIGRFVTINIGTNIGHDSIVSDYSSIMANVDLSGNTFLGERVYIGSGTTVFPGRKIGNGAKVSAGSIVVTNIVEDSLVAGNPARNIREIQKKNP